MMMPASQENSEGNASLAEMKAQLEAATQEENTLRARLDVIIAEYKKGAAEIGQDQYDALEKEYDEKNPLWTETIQRRKDLSAKVEKAEKEKELSDLESEAEAKKQEIEDLKTKIDVIIGERNLPGLESNNKDSYDRLGAELNKVSELFNQATKEHGDLVHKISKIKENTGA